MNDKKILKLFKDGHREKVFKKLYSLYPKIEVQKEKDFKI